MLFRSAGPQKASAIATPLDAAPVPDGSRMCFLDSYLVHKSEGRTLESVERITISPRYQGERPTPGLVLRWTDGSVTTVESKQSKKPPYRMYWRVMLPINVDEFYA